MAGAPARKIGPKPGLAPSPGAALTTPFVDEESRSTMTVMNTDAAYLSPGETAKRLGTSVKALRLYERHGLVAPLRSAAGWRAYGPEQIARLHQVLALKRLGLPLARISQLMSGTLAGLDDVLAVQEQALHREYDRLSHALELVRAAREKLAAGERLSVDDLTQLTTETTMTAKATPEQLKAIFDPISAKYFPPEEAAELTKRKFDEEAVSHAWETLIAEAKTLMAMGDATSPAATGVARRWHALVEQFTHGDPDVARRVKLVWTEAMADPKAAPKLPLNPEVFAFIGKAWAAAQAEDRA